METGQKSLKKYISRCEKKMNNVSESCNVCIKGYYRIRKSDRKIIKNGIKKNNVCSRTFVPNMNFRNLIPCMMIFMYQTENVTFDIFLFKTFPDIENE